MLRILLTILLPILVPVLLYVLYLKYFRPRATAGAPPEVLEAAARSDRRVRWSLLGLAMLLLAGMFALGFSKGVPPGTKLIAPHLEDGLAVAIDGQIYQDTWLEPIPADAEVHVLPQIAGG